MTRWLLCLTLAGCTLIARRELVIEWHRDCPPSMDGGTLPPPDAGTIEGGS